MLSHLSLIRITASILLFSAAVVAQVPSPKSVLGFQPTDDRTIADWTQITDYFDKLGRASDRVEVREFGKTTLGKRMIAALISSPENIRNIEKIRQNNARLADPRRVSGEEELQRLIREGKAVVAISCSIHSNEIVASQMSMNLAYELATANDPETAEILTNTVLLLIPSANPDGIDIVAHWYRKTLGTNSEGTVPPELYHHYAGHDNNRDWFMLNLAETRAITQLFWQQWFPQIVFDVHQMGQNGPRFVIPPFHDPAYPRISPSIVREVGLIGYKMAADLQAKGIKGIATNTTFDMWWHGGFRTAPYYHNSIGILSEAASADLMTPVTITRETLAQTRPSRGLNSPLESAINHPEPWTGGKWGPKDIAEIEMVSSRTILLEAAKFRERYLRNFYNLGKENLQMRDDIPSAYVVLAGQPIPHTVARFLEILMWQGIEVHEMTHELWVKHSKEEEFHEIPLGSFLIFTDQPQRNNILSLFEPQTYPRRVGANGEPDTPYDVAGWTLWMQMGIDAQEIWEIQDQKKFQNTIKPVTDINRARSVLNLPPASGPFPKIANPLKTKPRIGLYKPYTSSMDEGWTRFVFDTFQIPFKSVMTADIRGGKLDLDVLVLPSDSENNILRGLSADRYPQEFAGGIGDEGVANIKRFVENGGRLVCFDRSCGLVIKSFGLPIKNVLDGVERRQFYNPGSILKIEVDKENPMSRGVPEETAAYFTNSSAFEVEDEHKVEIVAQYALRNSLLSGWMLGERMINGKAAMAVAKAGRGEIVLFAFRPQHRGQTWATFPLVFNSLELK
jgi:hypothetical protein